LFANNPILTNYTLAIMRKITVLLTLSAIVLSYSCTSPSNNDKLTTEIRLEPEKTEPTVTASTLSVEELKQKVTESKRKIYELSDEIDHLLNEI